MLFFSATPGSNSNSATTDIEALKYAVTALVATMASERPDEGANMAAAIRKPQRPDTRLLIKLFEGLPPDKAQAFLALAKTMENSDG